jgi:hypothetical protein
MKCPNCNNEDEKYFEPINNSGRNFQGKQSMKTINPKVYCLRCGFKFGGLMKNYLSTGNKGTQK